jgi:zinc transport system substrate-binding protein
VPGKEAVEELDGILKEHPATVMLWEGAPADASVALLKEKGIASLVFDPCGNRPESGDFLSVMEANVVNLEALAK